MLCFWSTELNTYAQMPVNQGYMYNRCIYLSENGCFLTQAMIAADSGSYASRLSSKNWSGKFRFKSTPKCGIDRRGEIGGV